MSGRRNYRNKRKPVRGGGHRFTPALRRSTAKRGEDEEMWGDNKEEEESSGEAESQEEQSKGSATEELQNDSESEDEGQDEPPSNPNHIRKEDNIKNANASEPRQMSRREREAAEKEAAREQYWKLHLEGKTEQAKADLARLALIRKQREEAANARKAKAEAKAAEQKARLEKEGRKIRK
ncbi:5570_t:CDS:2 [Paraglomus occultum]|uniref:5570_t:CDS:1 n=1 Tax=Paraglomus occultum TaxID=144539 RepID=A0A9N8WD82_9GLOM|nr:5570_t:CDS:2 [Paraglomus occultum]